MEPDDDSGENAEAARGLPIAADGAEEWNARADSAQASLEYFYGTDRSGLPVNTVPAPRRLRPVLNYWWVANLIAARLDARTREWNSLSAEPRALQRLLR